ncbi:helix-turn-helix domain-containing protein [Gaetbulibacter sp. M235]|uniref:helix-turn-helix transcriptional regulator n=1 Tax=Gaetbulibacter sp. M235 TaxID=3126510 RepID=UPI00374EAF3F
MGTLQFIQTTPEQLSELIQMGVKKELQALKKELLHENANDEILTRDEVCKILSIDPSTLWHWQNKNKIKAYGISGSRRYYKRSEIMEALKLLKK